MVNSAPKPKARTSPSFDIVYTVMTSLLQQCYYDFKYDDEDTVLNEIEEFYSYVEMPQAAENLKAWEGSFQGGMCTASPFRHQLKRPLCIEWTTSQPQRRRAHVELLLESLEHKDVEIRFTNARRLLYILQGWLTAHSQQAHHLQSRMTGTFAETTSPEHQLHWIFENCKVVRDANGLSNIVEAMKIASSKHDFLWLVYRLM